MKKPQPKMFDYENTNNQNFNLGNKIIKTTNINVLLNRVRLEKRGDSKKKIILSIFVISILSFISIIAFGN
tara:strand:+ start:291 stop:503 length:213 start_codon:yes stop_codon:yes gene_type:complete